MELRDRAATAALAARIAAGLRPGDVLALVGPLGTGKTTLVRDLVAALDGDAGEVVSPTFTLVQHYRARLPVSHVDAYRLGSDAALRALGYEEVYPLGADGEPTGVTAVEWADLVLASIPAEAVWLTLACGEGEMRTVRVSGHTETIARLGLTSSDPDSEQSGAAS